ncbi:MAG: glycoside hydrolase family 3 C-terminal domain-containing protein [Agathobacter sp.]|nr:glycoside hydrolase family 3 C-terminal domain-containing protein [Agathobacter sp.]
MRESDVVKNSYETEHIDFLRRSAPECMVLLKSDGTFPLNETCTVALYGSGARRTLKGGTGSGDVNVRAFTTIEEGLDKAGFEITTKEWLTSYEQIYVEERKKFVQSIKNEAEKKGIPAIILGMGAIMPEPEYDLPLQKSGELAIYVLSRISGEGADRKPIKGDIKLTDAEIRDILYLNDHFQKFMLVLNVGGVVDLSPVNSVKNILLLSQIGMTIGDSFADVLLGKSYPSGHLASTWAMWENYKEIDFGNEDDTEYNEGIFVGYRYFDTEGVTPLYPFGYGLGYTNFSIKLKEQKIQDTTATITFEVKNTGHLIGKEVIQVYISMPQGKLEQPYQILAGFGKTKELLPEETENLKICIDLKDFASYDIESACKILEAGNYILRVGTHSRNTEVCGEIFIEKDTLIEQSSNIGHSVEQLSWSEDRPNYHSEIREELQSFTNEELAYLCVGGFIDEGSKSVIGNAGMKVAGAAGETTSRFLDKNIPSLVMADGPAGLRLSRQYGVDEAGVYPVGDEVPAAFLEFIDKKILAMFGKKEKVERHGDIHDQYCSAIPIGTAIAQSYNFELAQKYGDLVGQEMQLFGVHLWLAPALNIQRSPLCGRNFEYYSEDPYISGKMAAAITKGVQAHKGCGVTIKHFCCNNQETNRFHSNSIMDERTLREIYLKGFEIAVKEANPVAIMTSYNLLNGEHTSQRRDLNVTILRKEWGYEGLIMSDWLTQGFGLECKYPYACASGSIKAGNDLMMPGGKADIENLLASLETMGSAYPVSREDLLDCATSVVYTIRRLID